MKDAQELDPHSEIQIESLAVPRQIYFRFQSFDEAKLALAYVMKSLVPMDESIVQQILQTSNQDAKFTWDHVHGHPVKVNATISPEQDQHTYILMIDKIFSEGTDFPQVVSKMLDQTPHIAGIDTKIMINDQAINTFLKTHDMEDKLQSEFNNRILCQFISLALAALEQLIEEKSEGLHTALENTSPPQTIMIDVFKQVYLSLEDHDQRLVLQHLADEITSWVQDKNALGAHLPEVSEEEQQKLVLNVESALQVLEDLGKKGTLKALNSMSADMFVSLLKTAIQHISEITDEQIKKKIVSIVNNMYIQYEDPSNLQDVQLNVTFNKSSPYFPAPKIDRYDWQSTIVSDEYNPKVRISLSAERTGELNLQTGDVSLGSYETFSVHMSPNDPNDLPSPREFSQTMSQFLGVPQASIDQLVVNSQSRTFANIDVVDEFTSNRLSYLSERQQLHQQPQNN